MNINQEKIILLGNMTKRDGKKTRKYRKSVWTFPSQAEPQMRMMSNDYLLNKRPECFEYIS